MFCEKWGKTVFESRQNTPKAAKIKKFSAKPLSFSEKRYIVLQHKRNILTEKGVE
jgi:hypothetical protein